MNDSIIELDAINTVAHFLLFIKIKDEFTQEELDKFYDQHRLYCRQKKKSKAVPRLLTL